MALALFGWARYTGTRAAISSTFTAIMAGLLALRLFLLNGGALGRAVIYSSVIGLVLGEAMWALNYWQVTPTGAGLLLLVMFYVMQGLLQQHLMGALNRRAVIEYSIVGIIGLVIAFVLARPG